MHVLKSRWLALAAICLFLTFASGCQINDSTGISSDFRYLKISPDLNLKAAPEGFVYELWIMSFEQQIIEDGDSIIVIVEPGDPVSVARFKWDPYLYAASDAQGNFLPLTTSDGMELPFDPNPLLQSELVVAFVTVESETDNDAIPEGPNLLAARLNQVSGIGTLYNSFHLLTVPPRQDGSGGFGQPAPSASYRLLSQSNKKGTSNPDWRDNETEGYGIWFANPRLEDRTTLDSVNAWQAYTKTIVPTIGDAYLYSVWIHMVHPESSFSNFGRVLANREPDFEFRDGNPSHAPQRYGPSELINRPTPQPDLPGVQLGTDPVVVNGQTVGYRYIYTHPGDAPGAPTRTDTCIIRVDDPTLTRCNADRKRIIDTTFVDTVRVIDTSFIDTFPVANFDGIDTLPKAFRITNGDTTMGPTLGGLLDLGDPERLNEVTFGNAFIFLGWEYEAWLVFTDASGIPPMSLGRFKSPSDFDSNNPYTFTDNRYDRNFHYPGEDFVQNLSSHHPSLSAPFDVINDPRAEKIWITVEPDDDFFGQNYDWAPSEPNTQFIYFSGFLPKNLDTVQSAQFPLVHRDLNPNPNGLNEGNFFPVLTIQFLAAPQE